MRSPFHRLLLALGFAASLGGCKQGVGDRCQLDSDCDGYPGTNYCAIPGGNRANGGTCQPVSSTVLDDMAVSLDLLAAPDLTTVDMVPPPDLTTVDLVPPPDLTTVDLAH